VPDAAPALKRLPATKRAILVLLKQEGEATSELMAERLGITLSAVRQHLAQLAADGFVTHRSEVAGRGRPHHLHRLTAAAIELFPRAYGEHATELLDYVEDADPALVSSVFERRRKRRVAGALVRMAGGSFDARVEELTRVLDEDGYLASAERNDDGSWLVTEHNCAILGVAERFGHACASEIEFIREALPDAHVERVAHLLSGAHVCAYEIKPAQVAERSAE
jgi:DeoR family suf operon transcriptional repressor